MHIQNSHEQYHIARGNISAQAQNALSPETAGHKDAHALQNPSSNTDDSQRESYSFFDFLDIINPLQHLPVINIAYRALTGDEIKPSSAIIGGSIYSGPVGAASGIINAILQEETGKDLGGNLIALVKDDTAQETKTAQQTGQNAYDDLPVALLAFAQTPPPSQTLDIQPASASKQAQDTDKYAYNDAENSAGYMRKYS